MSGFSKERRLEPQITIGLLTDQAGFPLMVSAFVGNKGETKMIKRQMYGRAGFDMLRKRVLLA